MVFTDYAEAKAAAEAADMSFVAFGPKAGPDTMTVSGYVLVAADASPTECRDAAFEAMHGRPFHPNEELLLTLAEARSAED